MRMKWGSAQLCRCPQNLNYLKYLTRTVPLKLKLAWPWSEKVYCDYFCLYMKSNIEMHISSQSSR